MKTINSKVGHGVHTVEATATICGKDINICIGGGDTYHIGAVALGVPRPSLADSERISASASVLCVTSHKDDEIAREAALRFAARFATRVSVTCGLHIDDASEADINLLYENYINLLDQLEVLIQKNI